MKKRSAGSKTFSETVRITGHLIDSLTLPKILDRVVQFGGDFEIQNMRIGKKRTDLSEAVIRVTFPRKTKLEKTLVHLKRYGAEPEGRQNVETKSAPKNGVFPDGFYTTTNLETFIYHKNRWIRVKNQEMDLGIRLDKSGRSAEGVAMAEAVRGDRIVVGHQGVRVRVPKRNPEMQKFQFMTSSVSTEKPKASEIAQVAARMREARNGGKKILLVGGPAIVHTGAVPYVERLIRKGWIHFLFAGNALAAHDVENALFGTSLGVFLDGRGHAEHGHEHHLHAINRIRKAGGIRAAVRKKILKSGIFHACVKHRVPFHLAGSIRDDGPLPEVVTDTMEAKRIMRKNLKGVGFVLMVATALHSIAVGNLLPASIPSVCVDINPATITKLKDRGTLPMDALVLDSESFFRELCDLLVA
jgi:lysine-ketoglutarate reductase/saccharopine dehydrogenase-like protein (TIGR00300 family)